MILLADSKVPPFLLPLHQKMVKFQDSLDPIELNNYWIAMEYIENQENRVELFKFYRDQGFNYKGMALLLNLLRLREGDKAIKHTQNEIAEIMGVKRQVVLAAMKQLIDLGIVKVVGKGDYKILVDFGIK